MKADNIRIDYILSKNVRRVTFDVIDEVSLDEPYIQFWQMMDQIAAKWGVDPMCPCGQRPHRVACPLGFSKYFRAPLSKEEIEAGV